MEAEDKIAGEPSANRRGTLPRGLDFHALFERATDGMLLADTQTRRFLLANPEIQRMLGYSEAELLQLSVADIHPPAALPDVLEQFQKQIRGEITLVNELPVLRKDGTVFFADISGLVIRAQDHEYIFGFFRDVTHRKQTEGALRRSEQRFSQLVANAPAVLFTCRADENCAITFVSENIVPLLGVQPQDCLANPDFWQTHIHPEDRTRVVGEMGQALREHDTYAVEYRYRREDGTYCWLRDERRLLRNGAVAPAEMIGFWTDITARKTAEAAQATLEQQNRQLQKSESLGRMAGAIAHHYNNQLQVILGNLELALDGLPADAKPRENLNAAMTAARRAAEVSTQMLAYLGQAAGEKKPLDLAEVCRQKIQLLRSALPVLLETDFAMPGPVVSANITQIQQLLLNLLTNAWEAINDSHGGIRVQVTTLSAADIPTAYRRPVEWQPEAGDYACLEVADTGCGIVRADLDQLFEPFFSRKFLGRGMGLPVVLGIARAHNGGITVESEPGRGSTFRVYLPVTAQAVMPPTGRMVPARPDSHTGTVLVVDDTDTVLELAAHVIRHQGFSVLTAHDGLMALELYKQHAAEIRCVLCDLTMPYMDGWQTIAALRQITPGLPIILASGYDEASVLALKHTEEPDVFLGKPYDREKLLSALSQAMASKVSA